MERKKGYKQTPEHIAKRIRRGPDHHCWAGDDISVKGGRARALRLYPEIGPCASCGSPRSERHHVDENTSNNNPDNILPLCRKCHYAVHGEVLRKLASARSGLLIAAAAEHRKAKTHCGMGHPYDQENTYINPRGVRICKICRAEYKRVWRKMK